MPLSKTSKQFLQSIFGPQAPQATVEWGKFDASGKATGLQAARAVNAQPGADDAVYWSVGLMAPGTTRANANVLSVHALVADDVGTKVDRDLVDMFMPQPTAVVESSKGNFQYVWAVPDGLTVAQHAELRAGMLAMLGVTKLDGSAPSHLFRLPEGVNGKPGKRDIAVTLTYKTTQVYSYGSLRALLPGAPGLQGSSVQGAGGRPNSGIEPPEPAPTLEALRKLLDALPNDGADYDYWIEVGIAVWGATSGSADGFAAWERWSQKSPVCGVVHSPLDKWDTFAGTNSAGWGALEIRLRERLGVGGLAGVTFDDDRDLAGDDVEAEVRAAADRSPKTMDDFWAHAPSGKFIYARLGDLWPAVSVDAVLPWEKYLDGAGKEKFLAPSRVLRRDKTVDQLSWVPGRGQILRHTAVLEGGVTASPGNTIFNLYKPPRRVAGEAQKSFPWTSHVRKLYPQDCEHIFDWFAQRVQRPWEKINHALVLGGDPGVGKDTLIAPLVVGVGQHNFSDVKPSQLMDRFNAHRKSVVLRVNEVYDLGEGLNRVKFYQLSKTLIAAPPETLQVEQKGIDVYSVPNVVGVIMTSNHKLNGMYLPEDDRRHYVAWSKLTASDFKDGYFTDLWAWMERDGYGHVVAFLRERDLSKFNPKAPPLQTRAFRAIAAVSKGPENDDIIDVIEAMGSPDVFSWGEFLNKAPGALHDLVKSNQRALSDKLEREGYERIDNMQNKRKAWRVGDNWVMIYGRRDMTPRDQLAAAERWVAKAVAKAKSPT